MYIFDVHVGEHMIRVCVSVHVCSASPVSVPACSASPVSVPVCSATPVYPVQCYQPSTFVLTALLCKFGRLRNHYLFTHAKWLLLLMNWCCSGKSFELLTLHEVNAKLGGNVTCTCFIFEDIEWILIKFDTGSPRFGKLLF
jgi:hypothetical protein